MRTTIIALLVAFSSPAHAGPAEIAAALPNERADCRYLLSLCARTERSGDLADLIKVTEAAQVIRAKHEKMPACFRECTTREGRPQLNLERFQ